MTVAELVEKLRAMPQDLRVVLGGTEEEGDLWDLKVREAYASVSAHGCYHMEIVDPRKDVYGRKELVIVIDQE